MTKILCIVAAAFALVASNASAITLSLSPAAQTIGLGETATVDLRISGLGDALAPALGAYRINVSFDPAILGLAAAPVFGTGLDVLGFGTLNGYTTSGGIVEVWEISMDSAADLEALQGDAFTLATLSFNALGYGTSAIGIDVVSLGDAMGDSLSYLSEGGTVSVTRVDEPPAIALVGLSMAGFLLSRRRRR
jgi:MYXO-CTERM domain-containing protein